MTGLTVWLFTFYKTSRCWWVGNEHTNTETPFTRLLFRWLQHLKDIHCNFSVVQEIWGTKRLKADHNFGGPEGPSPAWPLITLAICLQPLMILNLLFFLKRPVFSLPPPPPPKFHRHGSLCWEHSLPMLPPPLLSGLSSNVASSGRPTLAS